MKLTLLIKNIPKKIIAKKSCHKCHLSEKISVKDTDKKNLQPQSSNHSSKKKNIAV